MLSVDFCSRDVPDLRIDFEKIADGRGNKQDRTHE